MQEVDMRASDSSNVTTLFISTFELDAGEKIKIVNPFVGQPDIALNVSTPNSLPVYHHVPDTCGSCFVTATIYDDQVSIFHGVGD